MTVPLRWTLVVAMLLIAPALAGPAAATDFLVRVPVHVDDLPDGAKPKVVCEVISFAKTIATGAADVPVGPQGYQGTLEVKVKTREGADPYDAVAVTCGLDIGGDGAVVSYEACRKLDIEPESMPLTCGARDVVVSGTVGMNLDIAPPD